MNKIWQSTHSDNTCPSCKALHGQVHSTEEWGELRPGHNSLYCKDGCNCTLKETDQPERGQIADAPLRQQSADKSALAVVPATSHEQVQGEKTMTNITFQLKATPTDEGFDMLAISEGEAKGHNITFSRAVLMDALALYADKPVFIDHAGLGNSPSVRNLAGTIHMPQWNEEQRGIMLKLKPAGPAADVLLAIRDAAKGNAAIMNTVGFSTVLNVQLSRTREVTKIVNVKSVDVVIDPARGGKFLSAYLGQKGEQTMSEESTTTQEQAVSENARAALELQGANESIALLQTQQKQSNDILLAQCRSLLDTSLAGSKLPAASQKAIRKPFELMLTNGQPFLPTELLDAIKEKREELSEITAGNNIQGPGRTYVGGMINSADQFRLAVADLFGLEREKGEENIKVARLRGIQDAYLMATGDQSFIGGYYPEFALVTANFPGIVANVMNKILIKAWADLENVYGWWRDITTIEHFTNLNQVTWVRTGTIASLPAVAERGEYTELPIGDNKETGDWGKSGGYIPLTIEAVLRDDTRAFVRMPKEAALAGIRNISEKIAAIFTQNSGAGPTMNDTGALFNSTAQTTAGGHLNLLTTALGTDYVAWNAVATAMYKKKMMVKNASGYYGTGKPQGMKPNVALVPADLIVQAETLFLPRWGAPIDSIPTAGGKTFGGHVKPIAVPDWTDATDWAAVNTLMPGIMLGEIFGVRPQIFSASSELDPAMFANDEARIKVRQFLVVGVVDDMPLAKNNVA